MPDHSAVRAAVAQLQATLRELETAPGRDVELLALASLEGQVGTLQGELRATRRRLAPPRSGGIQGQLLRLVVRRPGQLDVGSASACLRCSHQQARDAISALRTKGWLLHGRESGPELMPSVRAVEVLGAPERRLR